MILIINKSKIIALLPLVTLILGCASSLDPPGSGRFAQLIVLDELFGEIVTNNLEECRSLYTYLKSDSSYRKSIANGIQNYKCSEISSKEDLKFFYNSIFSETGKIVHNRFKEMAGCEFVRSGSIKSKYNMGWRYEECQEK